METDNGKRKRVEKKERKQVKKRARKERKKAKKARKKEKKKVKKEKKKRKKIKASTGGSTRSSSSSSTSSDEDESEDDTRHPAPPLTISTKSAISSTTSATSSTTSSTTSNSADARGQRMDWMSKPFDMQLTGREEKPKLEDPAQKKKEAPKVYGLYIPGTSTTTTTTTTNNNTTKDAAPQLVGNAQKNKLLSIAAKWKASQMKQQPDAAAGHSEPTFRKPGTRPPTTATTTTSMFLKPGTATSRVSVPPTKQLSAQPRSSQSQSQSYHRTNAASASSSSSSSSTTSTAAALPVSSQTDKNKAALAALRQSLKKPTHSSQASVARKLAPLEREDLRNGSKQGRKYEDTKLNNLAQQKYTGLKQLLEEGSGNMDEIYARNVLKQGKKFKMSSSSRSGRDEEEEVDVSLYNNSQHALTQRKKDDIAHQRQMHHAKQQEEAASRDRYNMRNPSFQRHRVVSMGEHSYLMMPSARDQLAWGHVMIVPIDSVHTIVQADENVFDEIKRYQHVLETMLQKGQPNDNEHEPLGVVYLETAQTVTRPHHTVLHCIPVSYEILEDLPIYFKKELSEVGDDWSTHKKIIETSRNGKNIRNSIPPNFPYFHVEWAGGRYPSGGMAHVIEENFPLNFGQDIVRGLLGQNPTAFGRGSGGGRRGNGRGGGGGSSSGGDRTAEERTKCINMKAALRQYDTVSKTNGNTLQ